ncbi:MAG: recombination mediator RecR [Candidatus Nomurabacteria bacterium]|jgi:recombination protein RecR|nr:recombination mediator RecR [Candidatus Nomurabacteria bacterium]
MKNILPKALSELIDDFGVLPGVGARTAERYAYYMLRNETALCRRLAGSLEKLHAHVGTCPVTFAFIDANEDVSPLYSAADRDKTVVAVVEDPFDVLAVENTGQFSGTYHVLGGAISPIDGVGPEQLHIPELIERIKKDKVKEIILATNASVEGESTALYIQKQIENAGLENIAITRLARGLPSGVDLAYTDQITLSHALKGRQNL